MARIPSPRSTSPCPKPSCLTSSAKDRSIEPSFTTLRGGGRPCPTRPPATVSASTSRSTANATRFTLAYPDRVRALVVVSSSSASGLPLGVENIVMRAKSIEVTLKGGMDAMAEFAIASNPNVAGRLKLDPSARKEIFEYYRMLTPIGYANALRALLQMDYITDRLREIEVPTLLVCGDQDLSLGPMREIQKRIPQAKFALLAPASHFANRDQPEAFNLAVVEFLMSLG